MDQLRNKLFDHAVQPPEQVWSAIENALDDEMPALSQRLSDYAVTPPANTWPVIEAGLQNDKSVTPVIPFFKRKAVRLAAAAVIMFAVFLGVRNFIDLDQPDQITSAPPAGRSSTPPTGAPDNDQDSPDLASDPPEVNRNRTPAASAPEKVASAVPKVKKTRYVTMSNDEGQTVRLSKKVAPVFNCATAKMKAISERCKEDIKLLQEKIGASFTSPSAGFDGLMDMLKSLEEDQ